MRKAPSGSALEEYVLGALPEGHLAQGAEVLLALGDGQKVVACESAQLTRKYRARVGEEDLSLRVAAGIEQDLPRLRYARGILEANPEVVVAQGDPARLSAPPDVDNLLSVRQQRLEGLAGLRGLLPFPAGQELVGPGLYPQIAQELALLSSI